jgi:hypothetical protein
VGASVLDPIYDHTYRSFKIWCQRKSERKVNPPPDGKRPDQDADIMIIDCVKDYRDNYFKDKHRRELDKMIGPFDWAKTVVGLWNPAAAATLEHIEGESKFFRSLILVAIYLLIGLQGQLDSLSTLVCLVLLVIFTWRFLELRWKLTQNTYNYYVALEKIDPHAQRGETI